MRSSILLLLLVAGGVFLWSRLASPAAAPTPAAAPALATPASTPPAPTPTARPQPEVRKQDVSFEIGESELTRQLNQQLAGRSLGETPFGSATIERLQVSLRSGQAEANGSARLGGASLPFNSLILPTLDPTGQVKVHLSRVTVSGMAVPESARLELEALVQHELDQVLAVQPMRVQSLEIGGGRLRATGPARP